MLTDAKRSICFAIALTFALVLPASASAVDTPRTWTGAGTDWATAANWDTGVPDADDTAIITASGASDPIVSTAGQVAGAVNMTGDKSLTISAGSLDVSGTIDVDAGTQVAVTGTGDLEFATLNVDNAEGLSLTGGSINGTLTATSAGATTITNAGTTYGVTDGESLNLGTNVNMTQTADITMATSGSTALNVGSHLYTLSSSDIFCGGGGNNPVIDIGPGGIFRHAGTASTVEAEFSSGGTIEDASTSGTGLTINGDGACDFFDHFLGGALTTSDSGDSITLSGVGTDTYTASSLTVNNPSGLVRYGPGDGTVDFGLAGTTLSMNGDFTFDGSAGDNIGGLNEDPTSGTFDNVQNPLSGTGDFRILAGDFNAGSDINITADTTASVDVSSDWTNTFAFNVSGTLLLPGTNLTANTAANTPLINIFSGATLRHTGGNGLVEPQVDSAGTIEDGSSGGGTLNLERTTNAGQVNEYSGTIRTLGVGGVIFLGTELHRLQGPLTMDASAGGFGTFTSTTGSELQLNGQTLTLFGNPANSNVGFGHNNGNVSGTGTINGPGTMAIAAAGGDFAGGGSMNINAPVIQNASTNVGGFGSSLNIGGFWETRADITDTGATGMPINVLATGTLSHECCGASSVANPLTISGDAVQDGDDTWTLNGSPNTVNGSGTVSVASDVLDLNNLSNLVTNTLTNGTYAIADDATLRIPAQVEALSASLSIASDGQLLEDVGSTPALDQLGNINSNGTPAGHLTFSGDHSEVTELDDVNGTLSLNGTSSLDNGPATDTFINSPSGLFNGTGTLVGDVFNTADVSPGTSPGTLTLVGDYSQNDSGQLNIDVEDNVEGEFDVLNVVGDVNLDGELALLPGAGYVNSAQTGDTASFLRYTGTRANTFATTTVTPPLAGGKPFAPVYDDVNQQVFALVGSGPPPPVVPPVVPPAVDNPPQTRITSTKIDDDNEKAKFKFRSSDSGSRFRCKLTGRGRFKPCSSPKIYRNLDPGNYTFKVKATDPAGQTDSSPAKRRFEI